MQSSNKHGIFKSGRKFLSSKKKLNVMTLTDLYATVVIIKESYWRHFWGDSIIILEIQVCLRVSSCVTGKVDLFQLVLVWGSHLCSNNWVFRQENPTTVTRQEEQLSSFGPSHMLSWSKCLRIGLKMNGLHIRHIKRLSHHFTRNSFIKRVRKW